MPSTKPDKNEIKLLKKKRNLYYNHSQNLFSKIFIEIFSAINGDSINKEKAEKLFQFIDSDDNLKSIFPNNVLHELLHPILLKKELDNTSKEILWDFISNLYTNDMSPIIGTNINQETIEQINIENALDLIIPPKLDHLKINTIFNKLSFTKSLKDYICDIPPSDIVLKDRFFGFTGVFENYTRKTCFEKVREFGSVPSEPSYYLDYLFVANKLLTGDIISSTLSIGIYFRRLYGNPRIFSEDYWELIAK